VAAVDAALPVLPAQRRARLAEVAGVSPTAAAIAVSRDLDALAATAIDAGGDPGRVLTHVEHNLAVEGAEGLDGAHLAALVGLEIDGKLTATQAKAVLAEMVTTGEHPEAIAKARGFEAMDTADLEAVLDEIVTASPEEWVGYCEGDDKRRGKLQGFFVGKVMKATKGQADGKIVTALLEQRRVGTS
jgi:aspartyl-tRNA(Asn)/glutamyl-tRNA(Gln) amidotransferase subunit B